MAFATMLSAAKLEMDCGMTWSPEAQATLLAGAATLITGIGAVAAAIIVGLRQVDIQRKQTSIADQQTKILGHQAALDELTLRAELFDKRFSVYRATNNVLVDAMQNRGRQGADQVIERDFLMAKDQAKFLFRPSVAIDLQELWEKVVEGQAIHAEMEELFRREKNYGRVLPDRQLKINLWLSRRLENLSELFGAELRLSGHEV